MSGRRKKDTRGDEIESMRRSMGLPDAWNGDPQAIVRFLRFVESQIGNIRSAMNVHYELNYHLARVASEANDARLFVEGYAAGIGVADK